MREAPTGPEALEPTSESGRSERLRALVETGIALSSELSPEALLRMLAETAVALTGARYGALGVIDRLGTGLEQFITVGIDPESATMIGELPRGRGVLGVLIRERALLRLGDLSQDPRSVGFPPGHPPMRSFLGVPIMLRGTAFGNLYLTEKTGSEEFTEEDEEVVRLLAAQAAVAIENARLYESSRRWSRQLESLNEVTDALLTEAELTQLFEMGARRLRELLGARAVLVELPTADGTALTVEAASCDNPDELRGQRVELARSKAGRTLQRRRAERVDSLIDDPEVDQSLPRLVAATAALYVPLIVRDKAVGVLAAYDKAGSDPRFSDADMRVSRRPSRPGRPSRSSSPNAWDGRPSAPCSRGRSSSGVGSRASSTTRQARRSPRSCSGCVPSSARSGPNPSRSSASSSPPRSRTSAGSRSS